ncbi:isoprenylcysteine carboxylmethyltransferase family protein [soil metagenome]
MSEDKGAAIQRMQFVRKVVLFILILAVIALAAFSKTLNGETPFHEELETGGLVLIGVAIIGRAWCSLYIGGRKKAEIVDRGPYSICRNPLYVFSFIAAFGIGAQTGSLILSLLFLVLAVAVFHFTVKSEEAWLLDAFGAPFAAYLARVPRFWPDFSKWADAETLEIRPSFFLATIKDGLVFLLAIPIFELLEHAQQAGWIHTIFTLP